MFPPGLSRLIKIYKMMSAASTKNPWNYVARNTL